jgi:glycosyltransferase involved in cell wall biosynthesis
MFRHHLHIKEKDMVNNKKISLCMVVYNYPELVKTAINSVRSVIDEIVIIDQGSDSETSLIFEELADIYVKTTNKGNADYDRQYCYSLASNNYILALDSDEFIAEQEIARFPQIFKYDFDTCWFLFINEVVNQDKIINLQEVLGEDPHPRLWKKARPDGGPMLEWPYQAHKFPAIHSPRQIYSDIRFTHRRDLRKILTTHLSRSKNIDPEGVAVEKRFVRTLLEKFGSEVTNKMKEELPELSNYLKD